ncbi:MAG: biotin/lipoyl-binding protein, partial [Acidobacteria bacterium]
MREEHMRSGIFTVSSGDETLRLTISAEGDVRVEPGQTSLRVATAGPDTYRVTDGRCSWMVTVAGDGDERQAFVDGEVFTLDARAGEATPRRSKAHAELLAAPMPAKVTGILVEPGDTVSRGDLLITLEAMKMELPLHAPRDGTVASISCQVGELV